jgi:hypothetical protein
MGSMADARDARSTPEERAISKLTATRPDAELAILRDFFRELREIDELVSAASLYELYESQWAVLGILSRSYQLMLCCIDQLAGGNWNGFYAAARGLVETLCSVVWAREAPERLVALVRTDQLKIGRMVSAGGRKYPDVKDVYAELSAIAHPNRDSHLLGHRPVEEWGKRSMMSPFTLSFSDEYAALKMNLLTTIGPRIVQELRGLLEQDANIVRQGRIMAKLVRNERDGTSRAGCPTPP